jgi:hypothetical protein
VAAATCARAASLRLDVVTLPIWYDVDDAAGVARLLANAGDAAPLTPYAAPAAMACIERIGLRERIDIAAQ